MNYGKFLPVHKIVPNFSNFTLSRLRNFERRLAFEALEWIFCSERQGYLDFLNGKYQFIDKDRIRKLKGPFLLWIP